ncbi:methyltransferase domain-containing protein [Candidatus Pacearchaeota archaeon]|nr:hypothetical protein [uncultured archaeon]MBS3080455.1 methyltransferase domain-containing protein [Candidatus Pacearchaeota archaeon]
MRFDKDYAKYYDLFNQAKDYKNEADFLEEVFKKYGNVKKILDLGCGTGLHTKELLERGYEITGLDLSEEMIDIAKKRNPSAKFHIGNMNNFNLSNKFDAIICMFSALGYLTENKQLEDFFISCRDHLKDNGLLILDVWNGLGVMRELPSSREKIVERNELKIIRKSLPELDSKNHINKVRFNVKVFKDNELLTEYIEDHTVRFFFPLELKRYMEDIGFELIRICPSFDFSKELTENDWNMVLIGKFKSFH